ncbi:DUF2065 domain-containing protein [Thalassorhabdomicrobium marinisediminis]|uniref:DUF2065 domain-containing protein n=1 Tax=Thalassorhabdomicrobium marinisediminis TaxID=2170577 RepID=A0A2T7FYA3_9RHOB|nr:DUF2065 domain-containing protein [Thalassorhabdomicrobium marinisediminis]PVA07118.1 DUF2065 domain-containing protein [Thalassorhabdomicrobium marinisediminis]
MGLALLALGLVMIVEGLVYALAPSLIEDLLEALRQIPREARRLLGFAVLTGGVFFLWLASVLGALDGL